MILGISGNFKGHLGQVHGNDTGIDEPKCIFPIFCNGAQSPLNIYPVSDKYLQITDEYNYQIEPEIALFLDVEYKEGVISTIDVTHYTLFNDCSIRSGNISKISEKKNWGQYSKGAHLKPIPIHSYDKSSGLDRLRIVSYIKRDNVFHQYNEDCSVREYTFQYDDLLSWITTTINNQKESDTHDNILGLIKNSQFPKQIQIAIGATRYTEFGSKNFLKSGDEVIIAMYDENQHKPQDVHDIITKNDISNHDIVCLCQQVFI